MKLPLHGAWLGLAFIALGGCRATRDDDATGEQQVWAATANREHEVRDLQSRREEAERRIVDEREKTAGAETREQSQRATLAERRAALEAAQREVAAAQRVLDEATTRQKQAAEGAAAAEKKTAEAHHAVEVADAGVKTAESRRTEIQARLDERLREIQALETTERELRTRATALVEQVTKLRAALTAAESTALDALRAELAKKPATAPFELGLDAVDRSGRIRVRVPPAVGIERDAAVSLLRDGKPIGVVEFSSLPFLPQIAESTLEGRFRPATPELAPALSDRVAVVPAKR